MTLQLQTAGVNVLRDKHWALNQVSGLYERSTLLEGQRTNELWGSNLFDIAGSPWTATVGVTAAVATSVLSAQTAYRAIADGSTGSQGRGQVRGTFTGAPEIVWFLLEQGTAAITAVNLRDVTASVNNIVSFNWATKVASVSGGGTAFTWRWATMGPNGGEVWIVGIILTGITGNTRNVVLYPTGTTSAAGYCIVHHAQLEAGTSPSQPIVTPAGANASRSADNAYRDLPAGLTTPQASSWYFKFIELGTAQSTSGSRIAHVGASSAGDRFYIRNNGFGRYFIEGLIGGSLVSSGQITPAPNYGDQVEHLMTVTGAGVLTLEQSINGGASVVSTPSAGGAFTAFSESRLYVGGINGIGVGLSAFLRIMGARGVKTMAQMRAF